MNAKKLLALLLAAVMIFHLPHVEALRPHRQMHRLAPIPIVVPLHPMIPMLILSPSFSAWATLIPRARCLTRKC